MVIKNFDQLAKTPLRKDALTIVEAGYQAIQTDLVLRKNVSLDGSTLQIQDNSYNLSDYENVYIVAFGKSSYAAAETMQEILGDRITKGVAIGVTEGKSFEKITYVKGTHPSPSQTNVSATNQVIDMLNQTTEKDLVITLISGGGSALLASPFKIPVEMQALITDTTMNAGASIHELNVVRKHISNVKGGRLAALAHPAKLVALIFSDVPGNDLATIASGATVLDPSTKEQAEEIIEKYDVLDKTGLDMITLDESPKDTALFETVDNILVLDPASAVEAMKTKAEELGYATRILSTTLEGEARSVGSQLLLESRPGEALIAAGETTVEVRGEGVGGRNTELVLSNLTNIKPGQVIISAASDGADHSHLAGAIGDESSALDATNLKLTVSQYLDTNDSATFFDKSGDGLDTGTLDSNISDMFLVLHAKD